MKPVSQALRAFGNFGGSIDLPFRGIAENVRIRAGQVVVLAGAAGSGKTTLSANWAWRSQDAWLYLALEDPFETLKICAAMALDRLKDDISQDDVDFWSRQVQPRDRPGLMVRWGAHTIGDVERCIIAFTEWWMTPPRVVCIDSLMHIKTEGVGYMETQFWAEIMGGLRQLTDKYGVTFVCQHHVAKSLLSTEPLALSKLLFGGDKEAAHVWGIYHRGDNRQMYVQVLKQRSGKADPAGGMQVTLDWQPERGMLFSR